jgi:hypothetical protein
MSLIMKDAPGGRGFKPKGDGAPDPLGPNTEIGRKLKEYFTGLVTPEVPDRFETLLLNLAAAEEAAKAKSEKKD